MRLVLLLLLSAGCATQNANSSAVPVAEPAPRDEAQLRACQSCRHDLELCQERSKLATSGAASECVDQFMSCLSQQQLGTSNCAGLN